MAEGARHLVVVDEFGGKYLVNEAYRPIAEGLIKKCPEMNHLAADSFIFIDNISDTGKSLNKMRLASTNKIPPKWSDALYQLSGKRFDYCIEFFKTNIEQMSKEQIVALVYHELRHVDKDGNMRHHDVEDWIEMVGKLGPNWAETKARIPDLLDNEVDWDKIKGQPNLFETYKKLQLVKSEEGTDKEQLGRHRRILGREAYWTTNSF